VSYKIVFVNVPVEVLQTQEGEWSSNEMNLFSLAQSINNLESGKRAYSEAII
jgi:hypothetical protein